MTDVFVSYERQDADRARLVVDALRDAGLDAWCDQGIGSGDKWRLAIEEKLEAARVVVCLWSRTSIASSFVRDEATRAQERGVLCPVLIDDVRIPLGFGEVQAANLVGWSGARSDPAWIYLLESVRARLSGAKAPERRPPAPRRNRLPVVASAIGVLAALVTILVATEQFGWTDFISGFPSGPGIVGPASAAERSAWAEASRRSDRCEAMREFLRENPEGRYSGQAQTILAARTERPGERWAPVSMPSLVTGSSNLSERSNEAAACTSAQQSAQRNAQSGCDVYSGDPEHFRSMQVAMGELSCECRDHAIRPEGLTGIEPIWRCTVRATYHCRGEAIESAPEEFCGASSE